MNEEYNKTENSQMENSAMQQAPQQRGMAIKGILKWVTVVALAFGAVCFFALPYSDGMTAFNLTRMAFGLGEAGDALFDTSYMSATMGVFLILPLVLTLIAALIMAGRFRIAKCIVTIIFCAIAFFIYNSYIDGGSGIGLVLSHKIALSGIILSIANIVVNKVFETKKAM
jgi:hypothetical protein